MRLRQKNGTRVQVSSGRTKSKAVRHSSRKKAKSVGNSEKRKEKSRDAARCRRGKESEVFTQLAASLPLPPKVISQLDKASIMRLVIAFMKTRSVFQPDSFKEREENESHVSQPKKEEKSDEWKRDMDNLLMGAMDGFLLVLSSDGDVIYVSENISTLLGLTQEDLMGMPFFEYVHPCDHDDARTLANPKSPSSSIHSFLRLKCTLNMKGRNVNIKTASYKVLQAIGSLLSGPWDSKWSVSFLSPIPQPTSFDLLLDTKTFISKLSMDFRFTYVDTFIEDLCGYSPEEIVGESLYEMHHALDSDVIKDAHKTLRSKGQVETPKYRFLAKNGGYLWLVTQATLICGPKDSSPQHVVCVNYAVSDVENPSEIVAEFQLTHAGVSQSSEEDLPIKRSLSPELPLASPYKASRFVSSPTIPQPGPAQPFVSSAPVHATLGLFTDSAAEEESDEYYSILDDTASHLKVEPEALIHLAPFIGDCVEDLVVPSDSSCNSGGLSDSPAVIGTPSPSLEKVLTPEASYIASDVASLAKDQLFATFSTSVDQKRRSFHKNSLLIQPLASPNSSQKLNNNRFAASSHPVSATATLFRVDQPGMDLLTSMDIKIEDEEDLENRAPYISFDDEVLDDIWGDSMFASHSDAFLGMNRSDDLFLEKDDNILSKVDDARYSSNSGRNSKDPTLSSHARHSKFSDCQSNFVDPNAVLPVQFIVKNESSSGYGQLKPCLPNRDESKNLLASNFGNVCSKRVVSPLSSPLIAHKKMCLLGGTPPVSGRTLSTPNAPMMQQLLVSNDPVVVKGRVIASKSGALGDENGNKDHSVLRNLLESGKDDLTGYSVMVGDGSREGDPSSWDDLPRLSHRRPSSPSDFLRDSPPPAAGLSTEKKASVCPSNYRSSTISNSLPHVASSIGGNFSNNMPSTPENVSLPKAYPVINGISSARLLALKNSVIISSADGISPKNIIIGGGTQSESFVLLDSKLLSTLLEANRLNNRNCPSVPDSGTMNESDLFVNLNNGL